MEYDDDYFDTGLFRFLVDFLKGKTVADLGCGYGRYVNNFNANGIPAAGYDGNPFIKKFCGSSATVDLSRV